MDEARRLSAVLDALDDADVRALLDSASPLGTGIGGSTATVLLDGATAFVKLIPLTAAEVADPTATSSHLGLPFASHYGIGSLSHGAGRELACHRSTSGWVEDGLVDAFPLLLGWRVLERPCAVELSEFEGDAPRRRWGTWWPQVQERLTALEEATCCLVIVLEYVPETLGARIRRSLAEGTGADVFPDAVRQLLDATAWMGNRGLQHFDVHPGNILVRDGRLLLTDFGLALQRDADLTEAEEVGMHLHVGFDRDTALMHLFHWTLFDLGLTSRGERLEVLRAVAADPASPVLVPLRAALGEGADLIAQYAEVAVRMTGMFDVLLEDAFGTDYPHS